jgi:hypothetical protein
MFWGKRLFSLLMYKRQFIPITGDVPIEIVITFFRFIKHYLFCCLYLCCDQCSPDQRVGPALLIRCYIFLCVLFISLCLSLQCVIYQFMLSCYSVIYQFMLVVTVCDSYEYFSEVVVNPVDSNVLNLNHEPLAITNCTLAPAYTLCISLKGYAPRLIN